MSSEIKADKWSPASGTSATIGDSGDTYTVPTGANFTVTDELKTNKISPASGTSFTMGDSGDTFTIPSGVTLANSGTATGFGALVYVGGGSTTSNVAAVTIDNVFTENTIESLQNCKRSMKKIEREIKKKNKKEVKIKVDKILDSLPVGMSNDIY